MSDEPRKPSEENQPSEPRNPSPQRTQDPGGQGAEAIARTAMNPSPGPAGPAATKQPPEKTPEGAEKSVGASVASDVKTGTAGAAAQSAKPAAKPAAKKAPPPPDPRAVAAKEKADEIKAVLIAKLGASAVVETGAAHFTPMLLIDRGKWSDAVTALRDDPAWDLNYLECMAGTDYPEYIEVVVYLQSTELGHFVCMKTRTPRDGAQVPSLAPIYPVANWEEREIFDLLGVTFTGHPDMRRIMMWEEFEGHPLRKDYSVWD